MIESNRLKREAAALNHAAQRLPPRRSGSIRRTISHQTIWKAGDMNSFTIIGRSRDLVTTAAGEPRGIGEDAIEIRMSADGRILALDGSRRGDRLARFAGLRPGGELRKAMARDLPGEIQAETRLHRLLDDLAGATFMAVAAWYAWGDGIAGHVARSNIVDPTHRPVEGVCLSYVQGSPSMTEDGYGIDDNADHPLGPPPFGADDPYGFHNLSQSDGPNHWRLRRTDLWDEDGALLVDAWFQDSSAIESDPEQRVIFHEYGLQARLDARSLDITSISVTPHVLPYVTCHAAPATAQALVGRNIGELRGIVPKLLKGAAGCTHLNDMFRALQDAAALAYLAGWRE